MFNFLSNFKGSNFVKNVFLVASGTAAAQLIGMLVTPFLARIYGPESIGIYGVFVSVGSIIVRVSTLSYPVAIVLPKSKKEAVEITEIAFLVSLLFTGILFILLLFFGNNIVALFNVYEIESYKYYLLLVTLFSATFTIAEQWTLRLEDFKLNARAAIGRALFVNVGKLSIGSFYNYSGVLIFFYTFGYLVHTLIVIFKRNINIRNFRFNFKNEKDSLVRVAKKYSDFPKYRAPQEMINALTSNMPVLLLSTFFGPTFAGFYSMAIKVVQIPANLLTKAIGDVFYSKISKGDKESIFYSLTRTTASLIFIGIIPFGILFIFGPLIFEIVLGSEWTRSGEYAQWLSIYLFFGFINRPSNKTIPVLRLQGWFLIYEIVTSVMKVSALAMGFYIFNDDMTAVIIFSLVGALANSILIAGVIIKAKQIKN